MRKRKQLGDWTGKLWKITVVDQYYMQLTPGKAFYENTIWTTLRTMLDDPLYTFFGHEFIYLINEEIENE